MDSKRAVLVTGASSGIGRKLTEHLASSGCPVYAGVRSNADLDALGLIPNVQPVRLDVTCPQDIAAAIAMIEDGGRGLYGLVNNAGIATLGTVLDADMAEFDLVMAVNVRGTYAVTRAFAPMIVAHEGRIVTIGSIAGILAEENASAYSMGKHAIEAFTDSLALEMKKFDVQVSVVEPGTFNTELTRNANRRVGNDARLPDLSNRPEPDDVVDAVVHALFAANPKRRYLVVSVEEEARLTLEKQLDQLVQLNGENSPIYSRDCLVRMMDQAFERLQRDVRRM